MRERIGVAFSSYSERRPMMLAALSNSPGRRTRTEDSVDHLLGSLHQFRQRCGSGILRNRVRYASTRRRVDDHRALRAAGIPEFELVGPVLLERNHEQAAHSVAP
jgi:hypothetical protein